MFPDQLERLRAALGDRYVIERVLGSGGMATVYLADDLKHRRQVAVKVMRPELRQAIGAERFLREIQIAARLAHPNILPLHDSGEVDEFLYYVMPYVAGRSLRARLEEEGPIPLDEALQIAREVADALEYAHRNGVVHRDIKPENIMLEAGHAVVTDFGVARAVTQAYEDKLTVEGLVLGTPLYMSPEQAIGAQSLDGRTDIYALGCVLYEMLAGTPPFSGSAIEQMLDGERRVSAPGVPAVRVPHLIELAVKRALARRPDDRFPTAREFADALRASPADVPAPSRIRRGRLVAMAAGALAVGLTLTWWWLSRPSRGSSAGGEPPRVAILPFEVSGTLEGIDLATALPRLFEDQLHHWPQLYRVVNSEALARAIGPSRLGVDTLVHIASARFRAEAVAVGRATVSAEGANRKIELEVQVRDAASRRPVASGARKGPVDSLGWLVESLAGEVFARREAARRTGSPVVPVGPEAVSVWLNGDEDFRRGAYDRAISAFDQVIAHDPSFAPAYYKRMLAELLRTQPTRAFTNLRSALHAARAYRARLDPSSQSLLEAYDVLITRGDLDSVQGMLQAIVRRYPEAVDAWFMQAYLQFAFAPLLGVPRTDAARPAQHAYRLDSKFAAVLAILAPIALIERKYDTGRRYIAEYLDLDSVSAWAELARMMDSLLTLKPAAALRIQETLAERPTAVLEALGLIVGDLSRPPPVGVIPQQAVTVLWRQAATRPDRAVAFRMQMASHLGAGKDASADTLMRQARERDVPIDELDRWIVLAAVTEVARLGDERQQAEAARRLLAQRNDAEALWLAARWHGDRTPTSATAARRALEDLLGRDTLPAPLLRSLWEDLHALDSLLRGDTAAALRTWDRATRRYSIEHVPFGVTGSLWPLRLAHARVAAGRGDYEVVLRVTNGFQEMAGFNDQVAWSDVLRLRAQAFAARGDATRAHATDSTLWEVLRFANGNRMILRDSLAALLDK